MESVGHRIPPASTPPARAATFLEVSAGHSTLLHAAKEAGLEPLVMSSSGRHMKIPVKVMDLRSPESWQWIREFIGKAAIFHVHASPPIGSISGNVVKKNGFAARQLRSKDEPYGVRSLSTSAALKIQNENIWFTHVAALLAWCEEHGFKF